MRLPRIINCKCAAIIAFIIGLIAALPAPKMPGNSEILPAIAWFIAAVFTWNKRVWAAILLGVLTVHDLVLALPREIREYDTNVKELVADFHCSETLVITISIITDMIGIMITLYLLSYVAMVLVECGNDRQKAR